MYTKLREAIGSVEHTVFQGAYSLRLYANTNLHGLRQSVLDLYSDPSGNYELHLRSALRRTSGYATHAARFRALGRLAPHIQDVWYPVDTLRSVLSEDGSPGSWGSAFECTADVFETGRYAAHVGTFIEAVLGAVGTEADPMQDPNYPIDLSDALSRDEIAAIDRIVSMGCEMSTDNAYSATMLRALLKGMPLTTKWLVDNATAVVEGLVEDNLVVSFVQGLYKGGLVAPWRHLPHLTGVLPPKASSVLVAGIAKHRDLVSCPSIIIMDVSTPKRTAISRKVYLEMRDARWTFPRGVHWPLGGWEDVFTHEELDVEHWNFLHVEAALGDARYRDKVLEDLKTPNFQTFLPEELAGRCAAWFGQPLWWPSNE